MATRPAMAARIADTNPAARTIKSNVVALDRADKAGRAKELISYSNAVLDLIEVAAPHRSLLCDKTLPYATDLLREINAETANCIDRLAGVKS